MLALNVAQVLFQGGNPLFEPNLYLAFMALKKLHKEYAFQN